MPVANALQEELRTYEAHKPQLVRQGEGKWVLIHANTIAGLWGTYEDALQAGYDRFGLLPFLVKQVQGIEQIHNFSRDVT